MHWDERQREQVQTLWNQVSRDALCQTSQTPTKFKQSKIMNGESTFLKRGHIKWIWHVTKFKVTGSWYHPNNKLYR